MRVRGDASRSGSTPASGMLHACPRGIPSGFAAAGTGATTTATAQPPPVLAQRRSEKVASTGEFGADAPLPEGSAVQVGVVAAVPDHRVRPPARASRPAPHRWDRVHQSQELGDVVDVGGGQHTRERQPVRVGDQVMLGAEPAAIDRARSSLVAPPMARTWLESTSARDQSSWSASRSSPSRSWWSRSQTPAAFQSRNLRQQVMPEP